MSRRLTGIQRSRAASSPGTSIVGSLKVTPSAIWAKISVCSRRDSLKAALVRAHESSAALDATARFSAGKSMDLARDSAHCFWAAIA